MTSHVLNVLIFYSTILLFIS